MNERRHAHSVAWTALTLNISLVTLSCFQFTNKAEWKQTWRSQIFVHLKSFVVSLDFESYFSCQIVSLNIYSLSDGAPDRGRKV